MGKPLRYSKSLLQIFKDDSFLSGELIGGHVTDINPRPYFHFVCHTLITIGEHGRRDSGRGKNQHPHCTGRHTHLLKSIIHVCGGIARTVQGHRHLPPLKKDSLRQQVDDPSSSKSDSVPQWPTGRSGSTHRGQKIPGTSLARFCLWPDNACGKFSQTDDVQSENSTRLHTR